MSRKKGEIKMITEIAYIADDGKRFRNKEECLAYEEYNNSFLNENNILFFNDEGKIIELPFSRAINLAIYIFIPTYEIYKKFVDFNDNYGYDIPPSDGFWYWDDENAEYLDVSMHKQIIVDKINLLKKERDNINNMFCAIAQKTRVLME
jgi:hypothetical protein